MKVVKLAKSMIIVLMILISVTSGAILTLIMYNKLKYPICYTDYVTQYASEYSLDSALVYSIISAESGYSPSIVSFKGAVGLMQIMPSTAEFIASELKYTNLTVEDLKNPQVNIEFGCFYLSYLFDKYTETEKVLYAYNAGEGNLINYLVEFGEFSIKTILIKETKNYIVRVKRAYNYYKKALKIRNLET